MKNSCKIHDKFLLKTKEYFWLGIVIMFLGVGGVMLPFLYDGGHPDEVHAVSFDSAVKFADDNVSNNAFDNSWLHWVGGVYYAFFIDNNTSPYEIKVATSTDGSSWTSSTVSSIDIGGGEARSVLVDYNSNSGYFGLVNVYKDAGGDFAWASYTTSTIGDTWSATSSIIVVGDLTGEIESYGKFAYAPNSDTAVYVYSDYWEVGDDGYSDLVAQVSTDGGSNWTKRTVLASSTVLGDVDGVEIDSSGNIHVLYAAVSDTNYNTSTAFRLNYTSSTDQGVSWGTAEQVVDDYTHESYALGDADSRVFVLDGNGAPSFLYYQVDNKTCDGGWGEDAEGDDAWLGECSVTSSLVYGTRSSGSWVTTTVDNIFFTVASGTEFGYEIDLDYYNTTTPILSYLGTSDYLYFGVNTSTFTTTTVDTKISSSTAGCGTSLAYNSTDGEVGVVY